MTNARLATDIVNALKTSTETPAFSPVDYPTRYGARFIQSHADEFVAILEAADIDPATVLTPEMVPGFWSLYDTMHAIRRYARVTDQRVEWVFTTFADGYLDENNIKATDYERHGGLVIARRHEWETLGYLTCPLDDN